MKISYVITRAEHGGAQAHVLELIKRLRDECDISLVVGEDGFLAEEVRRLDLPAAIIPELVPHLSIANDFRAILRLRRELERFRPDIVHCHSSKAGLIGRIAARSLGIPSVFTAHGWAFTQGTPVLRKLIAIPSEFLGGKLGSAVIVVSDNDLRLARKYRICRERHLFRIHNSVSSDGAIANPRSSPIVIISVARLAAPKDPVLIIKALAGCSGDFRLWFVGDGPLRDEAEQEARHCGISSRTVFFGTQGDVRNLLSKSQLFVLASRYEGLPISILEAMSTGLPVVASDVGGVGELVVDGQTGTCVPAGSVEEMRIALQRYILDPQVRQEAGEAGRQRVLAEFSVDQMIAKTKNVYQTVTERLNEMPSVALPDHSCQQ